jgi:hypothetical protein
VLLETDDSGTAFDPRVGLDAAGHGLALWYQSDGVGYTARSARLVAGAGWAAPEIRDDTAVAGEGFEPQIAVGSSGVAAAAWWRDDGGPHQVWASTYR